MSVPSVQPIEQTLNAQFIERDPFIHGLLVALVARVHIVFLGPAGTGKTRLAKAFAALVGLPFWKKLVGPMTTLEDLFGALVISSLETGCYERNPANRLPQFPLVLLDEIFKGSDSLASHLLDAMEERSWENGGEEVPLALEVLIGASNELPDQDGKASAALWDRFALRYVFQYIQDGQKWHGWLTQRAAAQSVRAGAHLSAVLNAQELADLRTAADQVDARPLIPLLGKIKRALQEQGITISDRRWEVAVVLAKAEAALAGRSTATPDDLRILEHVLWEIPEDRPKVRKALLSLVAPLDLEGLSAMDKADELLRSLDTVTGPAGREDDPDAIRVERDRLISDVMPNLSRIEHALEKLVNQARGQSVSTALLESLHAQVQRQYGLLRLYLTGQSSWEEVRSQ